jgi:MSHA biogenesis protein MshQ
MTFANAGFRFLYGASTIIEGQTSGLPFGNTLQVQAVKDVNGVCTGLFNGDTAIELSQENVDPGGLSGLNFESDTTTIAKHTNSTSIQLTFAANSIATIPAPIYNDAGQIRLHANYNANDISLSGSSNTFWVAPALLEISAQSSGADINGNSATSIVTHPAGEDFALSITAFNGANPRAITQNYEQGQLQFKVTRIGPTLVDSADGSFTYGLTNSMQSASAASFEDATLFPFFGGTYAYTYASYSEVGLLNLDIQDINYGNSGIIIPASDINIGRFVPAYFQQTVAQQGLFQANCGTNWSFEAYSGQKSETNSSVGAITYFDKPVFAITAYNKQGDVTQNYYEDTDGSANDFMHLSSSGISITEPTQDSSALGVNSTLLPVVADMNATEISQNNLTTVSSSQSLSRGTVHVALSNHDNFYYPRSANAKVNPFITDINFTPTSIIDADSVVATSMESASPTGITLSFGRMLLENSFGPETENIAQHLKLEHYNNGSFVTSFNNSCVTFDASNVTLTNKGLDPSLSGVNNAADSFENGETKAIELLSPGMGNQGTIGITYETYEWLKYDWDNDGLLDDDPNAIATFGIYKGTERLFNWREKF